MPIQGSASRSKRAIKSSHPCTQRYGAHRQVGRIGSAAKSVDTEAQIVEDVIQECDNSPLKTESEIVYEEWEKVFDGLVKLQNEGNKPTTKQVADFKAAFDKLSDEVKLENIPHAQNLFTDASIEYLTVIFSLSSRLALPFNRQIALVI